MKNIRIDHSFPSLSLPFAAAMLFLFGMSQALSAQPTWDPPTELFCPIQCLQGCPQGVAMPDCDYRAVVSQPSNTGTPVIFDRGHGNKHHLDCTYRGFRDLLLADGLGPLSETHASPLTMPDLPPAGGGIFVLASAQKNCCELGLCTTCPAQPSSLTDDEAELLDDWVRQGGSLLLILDHDPFHRLPNLLGRWGLRVLDSDFPPHSFCEANGELASSGLTLGVDVVRTFRGLTFEIFNPAPSTHYLPVLGLNPQSPGVDCLAPPGGLVAPLEAGFPGASLSSVTIPGDPVPMPEEFQGMALRVGQGRVYVSGEAAMFTAQTRERTNRCHRFGFQVQSLAPDNEKFLLKILRWLDPSG